MKYTNYLVQFVPVVLFTLGGCSNMDPHEELRLDEGCRGLLQKLSTTGTDEMIEFGSGGSGELGPRMMMWMSACSKEFGHKEAEVVCRQLGCGSSGQGSPQRVHISRFNVTLADIPPFFTPFPYLCAGFEESVGKCDLTHSIKCNVDNDSDFVADLVAVECNEPKATEEVTSSSTGQRSSARGTSKASYTVFALTVLPVILLSYSH